MKNFQAALAPPLDHKPCDGLRIRTLYLWEVRMTPF